MVIGQKYDIIDTAKGLVDRNIYVDPNTYQDELEQIFGRAWLNIAHESLVPNPNDFFLSYMGEDPVIVTRDSKNALHVFLNMCRHRGNRVVRADDGNAKNFMCTYHGWTFSNEGRLVSVPGLQEAYYGELDVENLSLVEAFVDTYAGLIFATWANDAPTLEAYLGDARWYLDLRFNRRNCGNEISGPVKWIEPCNWKMPVDNCSDNYHLPVTHFSASVVRAKFGRGIQLRGLGHKSLFETAAKHLFVNGHSLTIGLSENENLPPRLFRGRTKENQEIFDAFFDSTFPEVETRLGSFRARRLSLGNHSLFPNTVLGFRLALPRGPLKTEFWHFAMVEKDAPDIVKHTQIAASGGNNGPNGLNEQDDMDNWDQVTGSGRLFAGRNYRQDISMGLGHSTTIHPEFVGIVSDRYISENNQRNFYSRWQEFMNAKTWTDIGIDPITAQFEGTASMKG